MQGNSAALSQKTEQISMVWETNCVFESKQSFKKQGVKSMQ